uniref:Uncharacterized protein n=1 Tax=Anguilla anguilla TaxID=7936 RepID=A0A0E9PRI2_ANGAN
MGRTARLSTARVLFLSQFLLKTTKASIHLKKCVYVQAWYWNKMFIPNLGQ